MFTKTLNTITGKITVTIPATISELQIGQLLAIQNAEDITDLKVISILSGIDEQELANVIQMRDLSVFNDHVQSLIHQIQYSYDSKALPEYIVWGKETVKRFGIKRIRERRIPVIKNLSMEPAGAYVTSREIIADEANKFIKSKGADDWSDSWKNEFQPSLDASAQILANYFYCRVTGLPFDEKAAEDFKAEVLKLSVKEALPIARFFFWNFPDLSPRKITFWGVFKLKLKKKLALRTSKNSVSIQ